MRFETQEKDRILVPPMTQIKQYCLYALLIVYSVGIAIPHTHHHDEDVWGSGNVTLGQHEDADHCHHIPVGEHTDCALCASSNTKAVVVSSGLTLGNSLVGRIEFVIQDSAYRSYHFLSSQPHRGPPSVVA